MRDKSTIPVALPFGPITSIGVGIDEGEKAEIVLSQLLSSVGEDEFNITMDYLYRIFVNDIMKNKDNPLYTVLQGVMDQLSARAIAFVHQDHEYIEHLEAELKLVKAELGQLQMRVRTLETTILSIRKCLKSDPVKRCVAYCQKFRKNPPKSEIEEVAHELSEAIKSACIDMRGV